MAQKPNKPEAGAQAEEELNILALYVLYDKKSGIIIHRHQETSIDKKKKLPKYSVSEFIERFNDQSSVTEMLTNQDIANAGLIRIDNPDDQPQNALVDVKKKTLIDKPSFRLTASKQEIEGDGKDRTTIKVEVVDQKGRAAKTFNGQAKVITSRGKLSTKGGLIGIKNGKGKIDLVSVNETVASVRILVRALDGRASPGRVTVEFL